MLHPDFPIVSDKYQMTEMWSVVLPGEFNRRIEDGDLVIWRPGITIWTAIWGNDNNLAADKRLIELKQDISDEAFDLKEDLAGSVLRFRYRLIEDSDDDRVPAYYCYAIGNSGDVQMAIYFDDESDLSVAENIWKSIEERPT